MNFSTIPTSTNDITNTIKHMLEEKLFFNSYWTTFLIGIFSALVPIIYQWILSFTSSLQNGQPFSFRHFFQTIYDSFYHCFYTIHSITLEGKCISFQDYNYNPTSSCMFSNRFRAVWNEIEQTLYKNNTIFELKDCSFFKANFNLSSVTTVESNDDNVLIVTQPKPFLFNEKYSIYAKVSLYKEQNRSELHGASSSMETEKIEITLYSYVSSLSTIKNYIDELTITYLKNVQELRNNKQYIFTLVKSSVNVSPFECWKETLFTTTRSFDNMFFENKHSILQKIDFFLENKQWFEKKGIPYTLGMGLYGPPGTGKTSFIKSLSKKTKRHLVCLSLKMIKTPRQLQDFFFEKFYTSMNKQEIGFEKKILVIEDIDAQGDIVLERNISSKVSPTKIIDDATQTEPITVPMERKNQEKSDNDDDDDEDDDEDEDEEEKKISHILNSLPQEEQLLSNGFKKKTKKNKKNSKVDEEKITLDDILNLWDGIQETSGRMMIITSNHYDKLDSAITRPGRIDIAIEMKNTNQSIIAEMFEHFYETSIDLNELKDVQPYFYSHAEIVNLFVLYPNDPVSFLTRLKENKKVI